MRYILRHVPSHPHADCNGRVREHILIAEAALGRILPDGAVVHHANEIKTDNRNSNLVICENKRYHELLHARMRLIKYGADPNHDGYCQRCHTVKLLSAFPKCRTNWNGVFGFCLRCHAEHQAELKRIKNEATMNYPSDIDIEEMADEMLADRIEATIVDQQAADTKRLAGCPRPYAPTREKE